MIWLLIASTISTLTLLAHVLGGGKSIAQPVLASELDAEPKFASYYCWHMVTIVIAFMAIAFLLAAIEVASNDLAIASAILSLLFALWSMALTIWKKQTFKVLPQWIFFLPIAVAGFMGAT